jgi:hypothetical protein
MQVKGVKIVRKPKPIKGMTVKYDGKEYGNIVHVSRGYDYGSFAYLDEAGTEFSVYLAQGKSFEVIVES